MKNRVMAVLLSMCMLAAMVPGPVMAADTAVVSTEEPGEEAEEEELKGESEYTKNESSEESSEELAESEEKTKDTAGKSAMNERKEASTATEGNFEYTLDSNGVTITKYTGSESEVVIPEQIDGKDVVTIGINAFYGCSDLINIKISDSVTKIDNGAFSECKDLTSITIPDSVTKIGDGAFSGCRGLVSITIPNGVTEIGYEVFERCSGLTSIIIPDSVTKIDDESFIGCNSLTSITIPNSVTEIGNFAFCGCSGFTSITIPDSITEIEDFVFCECSSLTNIKIPDCVKKIGYSAFEKCSKLTSITIPSSVVDIENGAFDDCAQLKDVYYTGSKDEWNAISIASNDPLTTATIHYNTLSFPDTPEDFPYYRYVAHYYDTSKRTSTEDTYINLDTPCTKLVSTGTKNGLTKSTKYWDTVTKAMDAVDDPSSTIDAATAKTKMYSAILMGVLGTPEYVGTMVDVEKQTQKYTSSLVSLLTSEISTIDKIDLADEESFKKMTDQQKEDLISKTNDWVKNDAGLSGINFTTKMLGHVNNFYDYCVFVCSCVDLIDLNDSQKALLQQMYDNCPNNPELKEALQLMVNIMGASRDELIDNMMTDAILAEGANSVIKIGISEMWSSIKTSLCSINPYYALLGLSYNGSKWITNTVLSTDDISEKYCKMEALTDIEALVKTVYNKQKNAYASSNTEANAKMYMASVDLYFGALNQDYDCANDFVNSVDDAMWTKISNLWDKQYKYQSEDLKKNISSISAATEDWRKSIFAGWLDADFSKNYPNISDSYRKQFYTTISDKNVTLSKTSYTYNGTKIMPSVRIVLDDGTVLQEGTDYNVTYKDNINPGTAKVVIVGRGNYYANITKTFTISKSGWQYTSVGWKYIKSNGSFATNEWVADNGKWYCFGDNGIMKTGWVNVKNIWYYLQSSGAMATGWLEVQNTWYHLKSSGAMETGWIKIGDTWYYMKSSGAMATGWVKDGKQWYHTKSSGAMETGWINLGTHWYYLQPSGVMTTGWVHLKNFWYYLTGSGEMVTGSKKIGGKTYRFNSSGVCQNPY